MDNKPLILLNHPTQVRVILDSKIRIAAAIFPNEGVFCMGGWIDNQKYRLLSDSQVKFLVEANPFQLTGLRDEEHVGLKFQKP